MTNLHCNFGLTFHIENSKSKKNHGLIGTPHDFT